MEKSNKSKKFVKKIVEKNDTALIVGGNVGVDTLKKKKKATAQSVNNLRDLCFTLAYEAGWHIKPREIGTMIALMHSELSEALEGARKDLMDDHLTNRKMLEVELADTIIRIMDFAGLHNLDLGGAIVDKLAYNSNRADHKLANRAKKGGKAF